MLEGLFTAREMALVAAALHEARAGHLKDRDEGEMELAYTEEDLQRACASVAAGLATALKARADVESTTEYERVGQGWRRVELAPPRPWWRRLLQRAR
jgi:hypothetical protein